MPSYIIHIAPLTYGGWCRKEIALFLAHAATIGERRPDIADIVIDPFEIFPVDVCRNNIIKKANEVRADICIQIDADCGPPLAWFEPTINFLLDHRGPAFVVCPYNGGDGNPMIFKHSTNSTAHPVRDMDIRRMTREEVGHRRGFQPLGDGGTHLVAYRMDCFSMPPPWYNLYRSPDGMKLTAGEDSSCHQLLQTHGAKCYGSFDFVAQHWKEDSHDSMMALSRKDVDEFWMRQARAQLSVEADARKLMEKGMPPRMVKELFPLVQVEKTLDEPGNGDGMLGSVQEFGENKDGE